MTVVTHCIPAGSPYNVNQVTRPGVNSLSTEVYNPTGLRRGRLIYFPPTGGAASNINTNSPPAYDLNTFLQNLLIDGWQVISVDGMGHNNQICTPKGGPTDCVATDVSTDPGYGSRFQQTQLFYWDHIIDWAVQNQGGAMPTIVAGFSFGSWATVQVAANRTSQIIGYIARSVPTQFDGVPTSTQVCPNWNGINFSGINPQTMSRVNVTGASVSGTTLTLTLQSSTTSTISANQWVVIENASGTADDGWGNLNGCWQVISNSGTTLKVTYTSTAPTGTFTSATVRNNTFLNNVNVQGAMMWGNPSIYLDGAFINPYDDQCMASNAAVAGQPVTQFYMSDETHQWSTIDSNLLSVNTYSSTVTYATGNWVYYSGNVYQALSTTTGNSPTNATYWGNSTAQTAEGWIQSTFDNSYQRLY